MELIFNYLIGFGYIGFFLFIFFLLATWMGKRWADYALEKQKREWDLLNENLLKQHNQKVETYRQAIDVVAHILAELDHSILGIISAEEQNTAFMNFNHERLKVYGYLAMIAPQEVMDAQDSLMDTIIEIIHKKKEHNWFELRSLSIELLNLIRKDLEIGSGIIQYNGKL